MTSEEMAELSLDDSFAFSCFPGISCFNACCRDLNQFLTPYDVLRLKQHFSMPAAAFLDQYTTSHTGPQTGLPVVTLKPRDTFARTCPFVSPEGCTVYENRPSSCRIYPLLRVLSRSRQTGELTARYMLLQEAHCNGFENGGQQTVRQWIDQQGLLSYNDMNDTMMELIAMKNQRLSGPLPRHAMDFFYTALYDMDRFRRWLLEGRLPVFAAETDLPAPEQVTDEQLLRFSMALAFAGIREIAQGTGDAAAALGNSCVR